MIELVYYFAVIVFAYWVGRDAAWRGLAVFFIAVALHQVVVDGPHSFLEPSGCGYGVHAKDC